VLEYIQQHQTDFIRLKTQLLSADAGNDPVKRADMITQIVQSIAIIPDIIKRQIYTKDCSVSLGIQEDVLTRKVVELRKKYVDEQRKKKSAPEKNTEVEEISVAEPTVAVEPQQPTAKITIKEQNIQNLMQLIVRYGEVVIYQSEDQIVRAGEYIISELHRDNVDVDNALYQLIMEEYMAHYKEPNWVAATYFQYHPNGDISQLAVNMLADKYQLSRMYAKQMVSENVVKEVDMPSDVEMLPDMVQRMLLELKYTIVNERIDTMQTMLKEAQMRDDWELIRTILEQQPVLIDIRQQLCKALGNRVILH
jgi:DNA primase